MAKKIVSRLILVSLLAIVVSCGSTVNNQVKIGNVVEDASALESCGSPFTINKVVKFVVVSNQPTSDGVPVSDATAVINIPQNGFSPVAGFDSPITAYPGLDTTVTPISGNTFTLTSGSDGVIEFIVSYPCGGLAYTLIINLFAGGSFYQISQSVAGAGDA